MEDTISQGHNNEQNMAFKCNITMSRLELVSHHSLSTTQGKFHTNLQLKDRYVWSVICECMTLINSLYWKKNLSVDMKTHKSNAMATSNIIGCYDHTPSCFAWWLMILVIVLLKICSCFIYSNKWNYIVFNIQND